IVFLIFAYKKFSTTVAVLAGMGSAVGAFVLELFLSANFAMGLAFNVIYLSCMLVSGALLAGIVAKLLVDALAKTGALDRFGAG
ncbi:hypothetical protein QP149_26480, partial [Escherichia coli]|nr:hypothetical protein [Escherichia coli]